jgi:hypothetical protein
MRMHGVWVAAWAIALGSMGAAAMAQDAQAEARFEQYFKQRDTNGDGKWSQAEATAGLEGQRLEFSKRFFAAMDANKDNSVTWEEAKAFGTRMREAQTGADTWFAGADANGDDRVSLTEATAGKTPEETSRITEIFGKVDVDSDGFVSRQELRRGVFLIVTGELNIAGQ